MHGFLSCFFPGEERDLGEVQREACNPTTVAGRSWMHAAGAPESLALHVQRRFS